MTITTKDRVFGILKHGTQIDAPAGHGPDTPQDKMLLAEHLCEGITYARQYLRRFYNRATYRLVTAVLRGAK